MAPAVLEHPGALDSTQIGGTDVNHINNPLSSEREADASPTSFVDRDAQVDLATSSYRQHRLITASRRVPVRATYGHPRFRLGYDIEATIKEIAPTKSLLAIQDRKSVV